MTAVWTGLLAASHAVLADFVGAFVVFWCQLIEADLAQVRPLLFNLGQLLLGEVQVEVG